MWINPIPYSNKKGTNYTNKLTKKINDAIQTLLCLSTVHQSFWEFLSLLPQPARKRRLCFFQRICIMHNKTSVKYRIIQRNILVLRNCSTIFTFTPYSTSATSIVMSRVISVNVKCKQKISDKWKASFKDYALEILCYNKQKNVFLQLS